MLADRSVSETLLWFVLCAVEIGDEGSIETVEDGRLLLTALSRSVTSASSRREAVTLVVVYTGGTDAEGLSCGYADRFDR